MFRNSNPTFKVEKTPAFNSLSLIFKPNFKSSSAFFPLTFSWESISSFLFIPNALIVHFAFDVIGFWPVKSFNTFIAFFNLSPDSPTDIFNINFFYFYFTYFIHLFFRTFFFAFHFLNICSYRYNFKILKNNKEHMKMI